MANKTTKGKFKKGNKVARRNKGKKHTKTVIKNAVIKAVHEGATGEKKYNGIEDLQNRVFQIIEEDGLNYQGRGARRIRLETAMTLLEYLIPKKRQLSNDMDNPIPEQKVLRIYTTEKALLDKHNSSHSSAEVVPANANTN